MGGASPVAQRSAMQNMQEKQAESLSQEDSLEEEMATHSGILPQKILWTGKLGGLQVMGLQRVRHDLAKTKRKKKNIGKPT